MCRYRRQISSNDAHPRKIARIPRALVGSFLRRKYGKGCRVATRPSRGRRLAVIGKFDAEGQAVAPDHATMPARAAIRGQQQNESVRQLDVILETEPGAAVRNVGDRAGTAADYLCL